MYYDYCSHSRLVYAVSLSSDSSSSRACKALSWKGFFHPLIYTVTVKFSFCHFNLEPEEIIFKPRGKRKDTSSD